MVCNVFYLKHGYCLGKKMSTSVQGSCLWQIIIMCMFLAIEINVPFLRDPLSSMAILMHIIYQEPIEL